MPIPTARLQYLRSLLDGGMGVTDDPAKNLESTVAGTRGGAGPEVVAKVLEAVRAGEDQISEDDVDGFRTLEAIVRRQNRPPLLVQDDRFTLPPGIWGDALSAEAARLGVLRAIKSVARFEVLGLHSAPYSGTGFVVAPDLMLTNRHVAVDLVEGVGVSNLRVKAGRSGRFDFKGEHLGMTRALFDHVEVILVHPWWDAALIRVRGLAEALDRVPLPLSTRGPDHPDAKLAAIGYPARNPHGDVALQDQVFDGIYEVKRLSPGLWMGEQELVLRGAGPGFNHPVHCFKHDASTLGGNSGSCIVDLATGQVIGLHFAGSEEVANYAIPTWHLATDQRLIDLGMNFQDLAGVSVAPPPRLADYWREAEPSGARAEVEGTPRAVEPARNSPEALDALVEFLLRAFEPPDLRLALRFHANLAEVVDDVWWDAARATLFAEVVEALERRNLIGHELFELLRERRPRRRAEIDEVQARFEVG